MKKILCFLFVILFAFNANAYLKVTNNGICINMGFRLQCHDATYSTCGVIYSDYYSLAPGTSMTFANTSSLGQCMVYPFTVYTPAATQFWDACNFAFYNGVDHPGTATVDLCGGSSDWDSGTYQICGHPNFGARIYKVGSNTFVDFAFF